MSASSVITKVQEHASLRFAIFAAMLFFVLQILLVRAAPVFQAHRFYSFVLLSLIGITSGCAGWACGIVLSPIGSQAGGAQKVLAGFAVFWTGVVVGHLQQFSSAFNEWQKTRMDAGSKIEFLFGLGIFLLAVCVTFNTRFTETDPK